MFFLRRYWCILFAAAPGCVAIPSLPAEREMPVQEIMLHATCELRAAFLSLSRDARYANFKAEEWSLNITLTPRVDAQVQASLGYTGKSTTDPKILQYMTWTLGTSPGLRADLLGHRDGAVTFPLRSQQLLDAKKYPLHGCDLINRTAHSLSQYLGVREWLERIVPEKETGLSKLTHVDKPSFNSQIVVKFDAGNAGATFFVPNGTTFNPALAALYKRDVTLSITMTPDPIRRKVRTLPQGSIFEKVPGPPERVSPPAQQRLDQIQLERAIQNLRIQSP